MIQSKSTEEYIANSGKWKTPLKLLRGLIQETELEETIKWGAPVYTLNGKHIVGIAATNKFVALWFYMGALLSDPDKKLINAQEGVTKALRQWRFTSSDEIIQSEHSIRLYIAEAIENQKAGKEIKPEKKKPLIIPEELSAVLNENPELNSSFDALNLTRKREFAEYIETAKRDDTKVSRLKKIIPMITNGIGLNDKYR